MTVEKLEVTVDGDAERGWIVGVHDGDHHKSYSPVAETAQEARNIARSEFMAEFHPGAPEKTPANAGTTEGK